MNACTYIQNTICFKPILLNQDIGVINIKTLLMGHKNQNLSSILLTIVIKLLIEMISQYF